jgi:hypothetical protein
MGASSRASSEIDPRALIIVETDKFRFALGRSFVIALVLLLGGNTLAASAGQWLPRFLKLLAGI